MGLGTWESTSGKVNETDSVVNPEVYGDLSVGVVRIWECWPQG